MLSENPGLIDALVERNADNMDFGRSDPPLGSAEAKSQT
jgi:hypothetical protein